MISIATNYYMTYFLNEKHEIHFCGRLTNDPKTKNQITPLKIESKSKFKSLAYMSNVNICGAMTDEGVYRLDGQNIVKTEFESFQQFCLKLYNTTYGTIEISNSFNTEKTHIRSITDGQNIGKNHGKLK